MRPQRIPDPTAKSLLHILFALCTFSVNYSIAKGARSSQYDKSTAFGSQLQVQSETRASTDVSSHSLHIHIFGSQLQVYFEARGPTDVTYRVHESPEVDRGVVGL